MVYIDVRDRKFQLIFLLPVVLAAIFAVLVLSDQGGEAIEFIAVLLVGVVLIFFAIYLIVTFILEKMAEREAAAGDEEEEEEEEEQTA